MVVAAWAIVIQWTTQSLALTTTSTSRAQAFERVYAEGRWKHGVDGALCGSGWSHVPSGQGAMALKAVTDVVESFGIRSIADVPCGDGCFASAMIGALRSNSTVPALRRANNVEYVGVDIVARLIEQNTAAMADESTRFVQADVVSGAASLPKADLIFSRQMLQHLCNDDVLRFVRQVARSSARYALITTFQTDDAFENTDIECASGDFRPQDLTKPPFSLPAPLMLFNEHYPVDPRVALGLWPVRTIERALRHLLI